MVFIDTHAHIYIEAFNNDRAEVVDRAKRAGVKYIILPNIDSKSIEPLMKVSSDFKGYCFPLMGLHPTSVKDNYEQELKVVEENLSVNHFYGIGEIGIDLYWDKAHIQQQKESFRHQLRLAKKHNLPVVIHSRNAFDEIFEIVDQENDPSLRGVFHSFTGTIDHYHRILEYGGFMIGIGGVVTYKNGGVDRVVEKMDIKHIVIETDSPYLSPVPMRGKRNESANIMHIAKRIADLQGITLQSVASETTRNALTLFSIEPLH